VVHQLRQQFTMQRFLNKPKGAISTLGDFDTIHSLLPYIKKPAHVAGFFMSFIEAN